MAYLAKTDTYMLYTFTDHLYLGSNDSFTCGDLWLNIMLIA